MAAIICQTIATICGNLGEAISTPCRACCDIFHDVCCTPFFPYHFLTLATCLPPVAYCLKSMRKCDYSSSDDGDDEWWLLINGMLCVGHLVGAFYITYKIEQQADAYNNEVIMANPDGTVVTSSAISSKQHQQRDPEVGSNPVSMSSAKTGLGPIVTGTPVVISNSNIDKHQQSEDTYHRLSSTTGKANDWRNNNNNEVRNNGSTTRETPAGSIQRMANVLCYDFGVAMYLIAVIIWIIWQSVGWGRIMSRDNDDRHYGGMYNNNYYGGRSSNNTYECEASKWLNLSILCGLLYMTFVACFFGCSLCCIR